MRKRILSFILSLALCLSLLAACKSAAPPPAIETVPFTDSAGRAVDIPANAAKISPSGPLAQMFLLAIAPELLVTAASEYAERDRRYIPESVLALPVVGAFYGTADLNLEAVAKIGPELVIDVGETKTAIAEDMDSITAAIAVPAVHIEATLATAPQAFRTLGKILNREERGEILALFCEKILKQTDDIMGQVGDNKVSALYCLGDAGLNVLARGSFHSEVLDYVTDNLAVADAPSAKGNGNETDLEQISLWNPQVILFAPNSVFADAAGDPVWSKLDAVKNGEYYEAPSGPYSWMGTPPSVNRYLGMLWLTRVLYPDFADYDLYEEVADYYALFYHYELDRAGFGALTENAVQRGNLS
ncbi:MAG: ABC transporter substrate-binding protein [Oscillospiraceae bacterium]|jgi:iron complex transport system substrate-binding protein|nr:ABC transporter substrate-binding protein [Oscillospiraceae bacterium]